MTHTNTRLRLRLMLTMVAVLALGHPPSAQAPAAAQRDAPYPLELKDGILPSGRAAGVSSVAEGDGDRYLAESLGIVQPSVITVVAGDASRPVEVALTKGDSDNPARTATTDASGVLTLRFRTEGNLGVRVRPAGVDSAPYSLVLWVGDEMPSEPGMVFAKPKGMAASGSASRASWLAVSVIAAAALAGFIVLSLRRARSARRTRDAQS